MSKNYIDFFFFKETYNKKMTKPLTEIKIKPRIVSEWSQ